MKYTCLALAFLLILSGNRASAQSIEELVGGPLEGLTYVPAAGQLGISNEYISFAVDTEFDMEGESIPLYGEGLEEYASPEMSLKALQISGELALSDNLGIAASIPFILSQELAWNPKWGYSAFFNDLSGETGLGDLSVGGWYFLARRQIYRAMVLVNLTLPTGTSPDEVSTSNLASTGSGHRSVGFGGAADLMIGSNVLLSLAGIYSISNEEKFELAEIAWKSKPGNSLQVIGRAAYRITSRWSAGLDMVSFSMAESERDGEIQSDSNIHILGFTPAIGYQLASGANPVNISAGYTMDLMGRNYIKREGFSIHVSLLR